MTWEPIDAVVIRAIYIRIMKPREIPDLLYAAYTGFRIRAGEGRHIRRRAVLFLPHAAEHDRLHSTCRGENEQIRQRRKSSAYANTAWRENPAAGRSR